VEIPAVIAPDGESLPTEFDPTFANLEQTLQTSGPSAALEQLVAHLEECKNHRALLDALLLKARHELGLPLIHVGALAEIAEPARSLYENRYVEAIRTVGSKFLDAGDIVAAWPYYRAIGEPDPVARAIDDYRPASGLDEALGQIIDVAFNQGANPRRGWELILNHYGTCSAITALEQISPQDQITRAACARLLVRHLHEQLSATLRAEIAAHGDAPPPEDASIESLCAGRDWLFSDEAYHIDISHLSATVRTGAGLGDPESIALAADLCAYGRRLSDRLQFEGDPPFERIFDDHAAYFGAILGRDVERAVERFRAKIGTSEEPGCNSSLPAQVLVNLLAHVGRLDEAIEVATDQLAALPESALICPGVAQLCQRIGQPRRLAAIARRQGDLVNYAAALLEAEPSALAPST
jgi:hypothetical protein